MKGETSGVIKHNSLAYFVTRPFVPDNAPRLNGNPLQPDPQLGAAQQYGHLKLRQI